MKIGACFNYKNLHLLKERGFDFWEANLGWLAGISDEEFEKVREVCDRYDLYPYSANGFFTADMKLYEMTERRLQEYCTLAFSRLTQLGHNRMRGRICVVGGGGNRMIPPGFSRVRAEEIFVNSLRVCAEVGLKYDVTLAIEPLNSKETNFVNTLSEALKVCKKADHPHVMCLVDIYHFYCENEPLDVIKETGELLAHVHLSAPDRYIPSAKDMDVCRKWKKALENIGYKGCVSLEGYWLPDEVTALENFRPVMQIYH